MSNKNREITFYSLLARKKLRYIEGLADTFPREDFIALGWERKHFLHLWISANNDAYADSILGINTIAKLHSNLSEQLNRYYTEKGSQSKTPKEDWLNHTKMVFEDKYHEHKKAIFKKVVEWCDNKVTKINQIDMDKDIIYALLPLNQSNYKKTLNYKDYASDINSKQFTLIDNRKVFNAKLAYILTEQFNAHNTATNEIEIINSEEKKPSPYLMTYSKSYDEGIKFFEENYKASIDTLYSNNKTYIHSIYRMYYLEGYNKHLNQGWVQITECEPRSLTHKSIKEYGYYSGIVSCVDDLHNKYKDIFKNTPIPDEILRKVPKRKKCNSQNFKKDISELCANCPLRFKIKDGITTQIVAQAKEQREILTPIQFNDYLSKEIKEGIEAMKKNDLQERRTPNDRTYRANRIEVYLWNKERIKALNKFNNTHIAAQSSITNTNQQPPSVIEENTKDTPTEKEKPFQFVNNFDGTSEDRILNYFKKELVDSKRLTIKELRQYIKAAFEEKKPPNQRLVLKGNPLTKDIISIFYTYWSDIKKIKDKKHNKKRNYVELLGEYFEGYKSDIVFNNFKKK